MMKNGKILSLQDVAELMQLPEVTIQRWVHQGKLPGKFKDNQWAFKLDEIRDWANTHHFQIEQKNHSRPACEDKKNAILTDSIQRGGVYQDLPGNDIYSVFENALQIMSFIPIEQKNTLLNELLDREEIASTGIGNGIAIPHPRHKLALGLVDPVVAVFFLNQSIEYNALDCRPVYVLFFIFSSNPEIHLQLLSKLSYCLRDNTFNELLKKRPAQDELINTINIILKGFCL